MANSDYSSVKIFNRCVYQDVYLNKNSISLYLKVKIDSCIFFAFHRIAKTNQSLFGSVFEHRDQQLLLLPSPIDLKCFDSMTTDLYMIGLCTLSMCTERNKCLQDQFIKTEKRVVASTSDPKQEPEPELSDAESIHSVLSMSQKPKDRPAIEVTHHRGHTSLRSHVTEVTHVTIERWKVFRLFYNKSNPHFKDIAMKN